MLPLASTGVAVIAGVCVSACGSIQYQGLAVLRSSDVL